MFTPAIATMEHSQTGSFIPAQADHDNQLISMWVHGKAPLTIASYRRNVSAFQAFVGGKPLRSVKLSDVQAWADHLADSGFKPGSQAASLAAVKSLLSFGHKLGYLPVNVGALVKAPKGRDRLSERILSEAQVHAMIAHAGGRDKALVMFLYASGARASEVAILRWNDFAEGTDGRCVCSLFGKGSRTRSVVLPGSVWSELQKLRTPDDGPEAAVFKSRQGGGGPISRAQIWRRVKAIAKRAGLPESVTTHALRHSCCSHALDRHAPAHVVMSSLGHASLATTSRYAHCRPDDGAGLYLSL